MILNSCLKSVVIGLAIVGVGLSQESTDLIAGPISGYTFVPEPGKLGITIQHISSKSNSNFDMDGKEHALNEGNERIADPEYQKSVALLQTEFSINRNIGVYVFAPFVRKYQLNWNAEPTFLGYFDDQAGDTGLGDMVFGGWYQILRVPKYSLQLTASYISDTGSSPDDPGIYYAMSTGTGYTATQAGLRADLALSPKILMSLSSDIKMNNTANYTYGGGYSWEEEVANEIFLSTRLTYGLSKSLAVALETDYISRGQTSVDGEKIEDSESSGLIFTPTVGHHDASNKLDMRILVGFQVLFAGKNVLKTDGFTFGLNINF